MTSRKIKQPLTLSADKRYLIFSTFLDSTSVTTFASHGVTSSFLQHDKITCRLVTAQLNTFSHAFHARRLKQHACIPTVTKFHVVEEHSLRAETLCDRRGVGGSCGDLLVWKEHHTRCYYGWWRLCGWLLCCWARCRSSFQLLQFCGNDRGEKT